MQGQLNDLAASRIRLESAIASAESKSDRQRMKAAALLPPIPVADNKAPSPPPASVQQKGVGVLTNVLAALVITASLKWLGLAHRKIATRTYTTVRSY